MTLHPAGDPAVADGAVVVPATAIPSVTAARMAEIDRVATEEYGISLLQMMELAGSHLAEVVRRELGGDLAGRQVVVAAGSGNNGGGGLVAARHLANRGAAVRVILARPAMRLGEAGRRQLGTLLAMHTSCCVTTWDLSDEELGAALAAADVIVDAILGYGARGAPHGDVQRLIGFVARAGRPVVSLDIPSGIDPDDGSAQGTSVAASATVALALPKAGLFRGDGAAHAGRLYLADVGLPASLYASLGIDVGHLFAGGRIPLLHPTG